MSFEISKEKNEIKENEKSAINIALAGNPNVGKSVIFNQLTGLSQTIGNWPGKTVEKKTGSLDFLGYKFRIVDLPGIYSLSTYTLEEIVSRQYIISDEVDLIINVIDATNLERNLFFTFQLLDLKVPMILAINQMDILRKRHINLNFEKLEEIFKLPVLPVVAVHGKGVHELLEEAIEMVVYKFPHSHYNGTEPENCSHHGHDYYREVHLSDQNNTPNECSREKFEFPDLNELFEYGKEIEYKIKRLQSEIEKHNKQISKFKYPSRFLAIKLLEEDSEIIEIFGKNPDLGYILKNAEKYRNELENMHGEDIHTIISSEIYNKINKIIDEVQEIQPEKERKHDRLTDKLEHITTHSFFGYIILILVILGVYYFTFNFGDFFGGLIDGGFSKLSEYVYNTFGEENIFISVLWDGGVGGFFGAISGVLVYVVPFFLIIEILQDSGYLPRVAFLMDRAMHAIGVHGKSIITMILGFGCNVAGCAGCRIMETEREKRISIALTSLIPCAAVLTVVMGLVGRYLGIGWVLLLFIINFAVILLVGRILNKSMPGSCTELIMEMHEYRRPNFSVILKQTWVRSKEFIFKALPLLVILGISLEIILIFRLLDPINIILSPITVVWLGLPAVTGVFLIYGILRKELTLALLLILADSIGITLLGLLSPIQIFVFSLVTMLYVPCFATIVVIAKQTDWKYALQITLLEITIALLIGGSIYWIYTIFMAI
ncbi:MAG: ferrous iron transport protein B [Candidatus Lokiarchaeota archaeon]|nr:ferrous iron transport protein B [Candidatus Lokiarchaeota archaeon]MBD3200738.1 ferrous iron transport protein B [Candidatus Lokiarchaeota archaeon]